MESEVMSTLLMYGPFAGLFFWLLHDTQKKNEKREDKYQIAIEKNQDIIFELTTKYTVLDDIKKDVDDIKYTLRKDETQ